jgi:DNA-binding response OmpR family regulator
MALSAMLHRLREARQPHTGPTSICCTPKGDTVAITKVLLVDDDEALRVSLAEILEQRGFAVTTAANVPEALKHISSNPYDVLLSDLHMPGAGDGLTVVSAMRHANPKAVTMLLSAFPAMEAATRAILMQTDQILVKPMEVMALVEAIEQRLIAGAPLPRVVETVAVILKRSAQITIQKWLERIQTDKKVMAISMTSEQRTCHLPQVFRDLVSRLDSTKPIGSKELTSQAAFEHGINRRRQGYTAAMMVEESRMLQVCIFDTLQNNLETIDFSVLLIGVMTIADEIDSQLSQAMDSYIAESVEDALPA